MQILIVEDDQKIASFIVKGLRQAGYVVDHAPDGETGYRSLSTQPYDAAVVDIMLPGMDGLTLVETLRQKGQRRTPIIFLSARRGVDDRIKGLQVGGDDYLVKPFAFSELLARLQALIRRTTPGEKPTRLTVGELELDLVRHRVTRSGQVVELQPRECKLLQYLMHQPGRAISKTMIMEHVWDYNFDPETNVVETCVCRLRNRLNEGFPERREFIRTLRGVGYVLEETS